MNSVPTTIFVVLKRKSTKTVILESKVAIEDADKTKAAFEAKIKNEYGGDPDLEVRQLQRV